MAKHLTNARHQYGEIDRENDKTACSSRDWYCAANKDARDARQRNTLVAIPPFAQATELTDLAKQLELRQQRLLLRETLKMEDSPG